MKVLMLIYLSGSLDGVMHSPDTLEQCMRNADKQNQFVTEIIKTNGHPGESVQLTSDQTAMISRMMFTCIQSDKMPDVPTIVIKTKG